ncbi:ABC transporter ATP-binding protein [bacterium]|nr:ABC transporter ATP-binding protein [bacterium]
MLIKNIGIPIFEAKCISKYFGRERVLSDVNISLGNREFLALFGANGAGKTTLLRIIACLTKPDSGGVFFNGANINEDNNSFRKSVGFVSHSTLLYRSLTASENLRIFGNLYKIENLEARVRDVLVTVGLLNRASEPIRNFSRGMLQRLTIGRAILHNPSFLLFDEPYTGLDQKASDVMNKILRDVHSEGKSAIITTHNIELGLQAADRVAVLKKGCIVYEDKREHIDSGEFKKMYQEISF